MALFRDVGTICTKRSRIDRNGLAHPPMAKIIRTKKSKEEAQAFLKEFLERYAQDERILRMKNSIHHPPITAYTHSLRVVCKSVDLAVSLKASVNWDDMLMAALLHDFYLYDFSENSSFRNGIIHPLKAEENAKALFEVNDHVASTIRTHMFPVIFWRLPVSREAWIVSLADKLVATTEYVKRK